MSNQQNIFKGMKESITAKNVEINGFKNVNKSDEISHGVFTKRTVDIQSTIANLQSIVSISENQLSYANFVKNGGSIQRIIITDKVSTEAKIRFLAKK